MQPSLTSTPVAPIIPLAPDLAAGMDTAGPKHPTPILRPDMPMAEYVHSALRMHEASLPKPGLMTKIFLKPMRWVGDAMLNVPPINRICCALGLTAGLFAGAETARLLAGRTFNTMAAIEAPKLRFLKPFHGVLKIDPNSNSMADRWKKLVMWGIFSLGGLIGVMMGTTAAYKSTYKRNRHPESIEDYVARVSQEEGDRWTPAVGISAIFASASGYSMVPLPGVNYGFSLASRVTLMQDRNNMLPGVHGWLSGAPTTSYMSVREALKDLCNYAVNNPSETPVALEYKAFNILGQLFPQATAEHIQRFVNEIHQVRDKYYQPGLGVPNDRKKAMLEEMRARFTKEGLEDTLIKIGLNPRAIDLIEMNGFMGRMANRMGSKEVVEKLQQELDTKLVKRHPELPPGTNMLLPVKNKEPQTAPEVTQAAPAVETPATPEAPEKETSYAARVGKKEIPVTAPPPASFQEREAKKPEESVSIGAA